MDSIFTFFFGPVDSTPFDSRIEDVEVEVLDGDDPSGSGSQCVVA